LKIGINLSLQIAEDFKFFPYDWEKTIPDDYEQIIPDDEKVVMM